MKYKYLFSLLFGLWITLGYAQEILTKDKAVDLALEYNYGILIAKNNVAIAKNNASVYNSGFLPNVSVNAGTTLRVNDTEVDFQDGSNSDTNGAESTNYNASIGLNYTLFDGLGRAYNYKKLKESFQLSELEAETVIENSLLQLFIVYYEVAKLTENNKNIQSSLEISKRRLTRVSYGFDYGQSTKLQVLNAEVDVNNDSIAFINAQRNLINAKRDLNLILGRPISSDFLVDTNVVFEIAFDLDTLLEKAKGYNVEMQIVQKNLKLSEFDININKSNLYPSLNFSTSYGFNKTNNDATFSIANQYSQGLNAGLSLSWDVFDGGKTKTRLQNAKIVADNLQVRKEEIENSLERDVSNAFEIYQNALFVLQAEYKNVETNERNFARTEEQFKLGQITSIEFRQAQLNLLDAQSNLNEAKYEAKNAELRLLQLTGDLLNVNF